MSFMYKSGSRQMEPAMKIFQAEDGRQTLHAAD